MGDKKKFYFTYGADAHKGGWTCVIARNQHEAVLLWQMCYPQKPNDPYLDFSFCYDEEAFEKTKMAKEGNLGAFCWDIIEMKHTILVGGGEK